LLDQPATVRKIRVVRLIGAEEAPGLRKRAERAPGVYADGNIKVGGCPRAITREAGDCPPAATRGTVPMEPRRSGQGSGRREREQRKDYRRP